MRHNLAAPATDSHQDKTTFGFWLYLMTDCVLFASLFATFLVLRNNTFGGPAGQDLFSLNYVLIQTLLLLTSSFTAGMAMLAYYKKRKSETLKYLLVTFVLGLAFLSMELYEFAKLYSEGHSWRQSGFLTAYFTLVGTHGLHISIGLIWLAVLGVRIYFKGLSQNVGKRLTMFSLFWHFLDIIWIFIFTIVYLLGEV